MNFTFRLFVFVTCVAAVLCRDTTDVQAHLDCPKEVWGDLGQDVTLTCSLKPPQDVRDRTHEWEFNDSKLVFVYRSRRFSPRDQHDQFKGRVFVGSNFSLSEGRLSVNITHLTTADRGTYSCHVRIGDNQPSCRTELRIVDPKEASENSNKTRRVDPKEASENSNKTPRGDTDSNDKNTEDPTAVTAGVSVGTIVGISVGLLAVIVGIGIWWRCRNGERGQQEVQQEVQEEEQQELRVLMPEPQQ